MKNPIPGQLDYNPFTNNGIYKFRFYHTIEAFHCQYAYVTYPPGAPVPDMAEFT